MITGALFEMWKRSFTFVLNGCFNCRMGNQVYAGEIAWEFIRVFSCKSQVFDV